MNRNIVQRYYRGEHIYVIYWLTRIYYKKSIDNIAIKE